MNARMRRIIADYKEIKEKFYNHPHILVEPIGDEPVEKYKITYYINGISLNENEKIELIKKHIVYITLHAEYPRYKPTCVIETPIWHPNFKDGQICIGDIWGAGESLVDIIIDIGNMIQYKSWNSYSPLSAEAADWALKNKSIFPIGTIDLSPQEKNEDDKIEIDLENNNELNKDSQKAIKKIEKLQLDENDFEITSEELKDVTFVPISERMQQASNNMNTLQDSEKINFKAIINKGLIWAIIGVIFSILFTEVIFKNIRSNYNIASTIGYENLAESYKLTDEANKIIDDILSEVRKDLNIKSNEDISDEDINNWGDKYATNEDREKIREYVNKKELSINYMEKSLKNEFNNNFDSLKSEMAKISRIGSGIWSGIIALFIGLALGIGEGIYYGSKENAIRFGLIGAGISLVIGLISGNLAQYMYAELLTDNASDFSAAIVRGLGWAVMGLGIGLSVGILKPEKKRIIYSIIGGTLGAFIGGLVFDNIYNMMNSDVGSRCVGIILTGILIGFGVGILEQFAKQAWLKVVRGEFEGKEYLVFKGITTIGNSGKNSIVLFKDKLVAPEHCEIVQEGSIYTIVDKGSALGTIVNGMRVNKKILRKGDTISIGNSVLVFNEKNSRG